MSNIPFVEKYRPACMDDIILDDANRTIIQNIIDCKTYPNLLLYGPPGTGKTTTIINLIDCIQNNKNKSLLLHLNASDERGIDTIRYQIAKFINSKPIFATGTKFIVLDEVDYMTSNAQQALKYLIQQYRNRAVFCLMCNYISKIETSLRNEFIELKFNVLPKENIRNYIRHIANEEKLYISDDQIENISDIFNNDIRSMINYLQMNYSTSEELNYIFTDNVLYELCKKIRFVSKKKESLLEFCRLYNTTAKNVLIKIVTLLVKNRKLSDSKTLEYIESIIHDDKHNIYELDNVVIILESFLL